MASSSSLPRQKCHHISLDEIKDATDNFDERYVLGQGGEGKVYLAAIKLGLKRAQVAVKHLKPNSEEFEKEIKIVSSIQHPNLLSLLGYCDESGQKILLYEFMEKGSLASYLKKKSSISLSWQQRLRICLDAARGLQHLHAKTNEFPKGIIHRDVKPDNILLDKNWVAKISDFGMFKLSHVGQMQSTMITNLKGTGGYYAPEYIMYRSITRKIDVYAFGVVLFQVLCLKMPWDRGEESYYCTDDEDLGFWAQQNVESRIKEEISDDSLKAFTAIVGKSLKRDPRKRPTMEEVVLDLEIALKCQKRVDETKQLRTAAREFHEQLKGFHPKAPSRINETSAEDEYNDAIVIDIGGGITKAGFAGEYYPRVVFESLVGRPKNNDSGNSAMGSSGRMYVGKDLSHSDDTITMTYPIYNGMVYNWEEYEEIMHHTLYNELNYRPEDKHPVLLTETPVAYNAPEGLKKKYKSNREKLIDLMFDKFDVPGVYIGIQPVLSLLSVGLTTGIVVESGDEITQSVPIYEGYVLPHAITSLNLAGRAITSHLRNILYDRWGYCTTSATADFETARDVKEKLCYIALNCELAETTKEEKSYTLPDGKVITLDTERFQGPEALFNPSIIGMKIPGIQHNTYRSITMCDEKLRDKLYGSIVLGGGATMLSGFGERMEKEMRKLAPQSSSKIKIVVEPWREYSAWIGGAVHASLSNSKKMWISKAEYEEYGKDIVHKKCF